MKYLIPLIGAIRTPNEGHLHLFCDSFVKSPWPILCDESPGDVANVARDFKNEVTPRAFHVISFVD